MACGSCISKCLCSCSSKSNEVFSFFKVMKGDFSSAVEIPDKLATKIKSRNCKDAILQGPSGHLWHVSLCYTDCSASFMDGWHSFVSDNGVAGKDILVFSHVNETYFVVQVFGPNGCEKQSTSVLQSHTSCCLKQKIPIKVCNQETCEHRKMPSKSSAIVHISLSTEEFDVPAYFNGVHEIIPGSDTDSISEISGALSPVASMEPQFVVVLKKGAICGKSCRIAIPVGFAKLWLPKANIPVILVHHEKPGMWPVMVGKSGRSLVLRGGLKRFVVGNELHKHDKCIFKLVNRVHHIFIVYVSSPALARKWSSTLPTK